ncbi:rhomboid family intramembrane serine protease [Candidatus Poribacteria bacterium]|nr:MAG: rhomboid family intramembrane serine protease [Candidatus Poribacteria bacterium]
MFIPLPSRPSTQKSFNPRAVQFLIVTNLLVFVYQLYALYQGVSLAEVSGAIPNQIMQRYSFLPPLPNLFDRTLLTSLFLHDVHILQGGFIHIIGNMLYLSAFGPTLESMIGSLKFLLFYLLCGVLATLCYVMIYYDSNLPLIGASGAIAGVMGAHFIACPRARVRCLFFIYIISVPAIVLLLPWIAIQLVNVYFSFQGASIAWVAHVGGFGVGMFLIRKFQRIWFRPKHEPFHIRPYVR